MRSGLVAALGVMLAAFADAAASASLRDMLNHSMPKRSRMNGQMPRGAISMAVTATAPSVTRYQLPESAKTLVSASRIP